MTRVAIYIRVSTPHQAEEGYSLEAQEKTLREHCEVKGYEVVGLYADKGRSGKNVSGRPELQKLIGDGKTKNFDLVLVWKLTRFTRSLTDLCSVCDELEAHNVYLESYSEAFDSRSPVGKMIRNILGVIAEWERQVISENVALAAATRAAQGKRTFAYVLGYDRDGKDSITINEEEAKVVRFIFDAYLRYKSTIAVRDMANLLGYRGKKGRPFSAHSIWRILTRPVYAGYYSFHEQIVAIGDFEPIIDVSTWNRVQRLMQQRRCKGGRQSVKHVFKLIKP
jgi:site-specific DNA recombinase